MAEKKTSTRFVLALGAATVLLAVVCWYVWFRGPPQMGADEETFRAVDALFTAVTARDPKLLGQCEQRLHALQKTDKLPAGAADYLDGVIRTAHAGRWDRAASSLYDFMLAQRREGAADARTAKKTNPHAPAGTR